MPAVKTIHEIFFCPKPRLNGIERGNFGGDALSWFRAELRMEAEDEPIHLPRYLANEEDLRDELNSWAAWLETVEDNKYVRRLMQQMIGAAQVFTFQLAPDLDEDETALQMCLAACKHLAQETQGVYQVDHKGFYAPNGTAVRFKATDTSGASVTSTSVTWT